MTDKGWQEAVLSFWYEELKPKDWFVSSDQVDEQIKNRFSELHTQIAQAPQPPADATPQWSLASIIVLDQFSRNMFRNSARAFRHDNDALVITKHALTHNHDANMNNSEKQFLYMPLMHSENIEDQNKCVELFNLIDLGKHAVDHQVIIEQFGRFPHRNEVLGRQSTPEEIEYLKNANRFGQ